jgi:hypothetical protein
VAQLTGCLHSVGTARLAQCTWPTIGPVAAHVHDRLTAHNGGSGPRLSGLAAHDRAAHLGAARAARALGGTACTLDGGLHARWHDDFTDAGEWPATRSERRCLTRTERRPRRRCLSAWRRTGCGGAARLRSCTVVYTREGAA